jgi:hypothetical protein
MSRTKRNRLIHGVLTVVWLVLIVPAVLWWKDSVPFLVIVSVYANVAGHWAAYEAATPTKEEE